MTTRTELTIQRVKDWDGLYCHYGSWNLNTGEPIVTKYYVIPYEEAPCEPVAKKEFSTLAAARAECKRHGWPVDRSQAGERYDDGTIHVEAYYANAHRSSGVWIVRAESAPEWSD